MKCKGTFKINWLPLLWPLGIFLLGLLLGLLLCWYLRPVENCMECPVVECPELPPISLECPKQDPPIVNLTCPDPVVNVECKNEPECW